MWKERQQLQSEYSQFRAKLGSKYGPIAGVVYEVRKIQQQLPDKAALLTWLDRANPADPKGDHWACVVRHSGPPVWAQLSGSGQDAAWTKDDTELPRCFRDLLKEPGNDAERVKLGQQLNAQRLAPLEKHLDGIKHLIVLPSPAMAGIPIETLTDRYSISYAPSGTLYAYLQEQRASAESTGRLRDPARLLALGDPVFLPEPEEKERPKPPAKGLLVVAVQPGQNAHKAGMRDGDVLVKYGETVVENIDDLKKGMSLNPKGCRVSVWRDGEVVRVDVGPGRLVFGWERAHRLRRWPRVGLRRMRFSAVVGGMSLLLCRVPDVKSKPLPATSQRLPHCSAPRPANSS